MAQAILSVELQNHSEKRTKTKNIPKIFCFHDDGHCNRVKINSNVSVSILVELTTCDHAWSKLNSVGMSSRCCRRIFFSSGGGNSTPRICSDKTRHSAGKRDGSSSSSIKCSIKSLPASVSAKLGFRLCSTLCAQWWGTEPQDRTNTNLTSPAETSPADP